MVRRPSRRTFIKTTAAIGAGYYVAGGLNAQESKSAIEEIRFACFGVGGKGQSDSADAARTGKVVAYCDVDSDTLEKQGRRFKDGKAYTDYRKCLDEMGKNVDAVTVSTPDHMHAPIGTMAMEMGLHCFCQKPMTKSIQEARIMAKMAADKKLVTQMGNQGTAGSALREAAAILKSGALGKIKHVHIWTNRPVWPQGDVKPEPQPVPEGLNWDVWVGSAPFVEYSPAYHPFKWRGFWNFGTGALGDMACHTLNMPFMGLDLRDPTSVTAQTSGHDGITFPKWSIIDYEFPKNDTRDALVFTWYDGGKLPPLDIVPDEAFNKAADGTKQLSSSGALVLGEKGAIYSGDDYCGSYKLIGIDKPAVDFKQSPGHFDEYAQGIKANDPSLCMSNFPNYAGPLTETVLLGNLAVWTGQKVEWNAKDMTSSAPADAEFLIRRKYRDGFGLSGQQA